MDFMQLGASLLEKQMGGSGNSDAIGSALGSLLSGSDGTPDLGKLVSGMQGSGLGSIADSWLGDGQNESISTGQLQDLFGGDKIKDVASQLGTDEGSLLNSLTDVLPQLLDKSSKGGSLLDSLGGVGGVLNMASKLF
ncbi:MAG: YidB family protein [bacterium]